MFDSALMTNFHFLRPLWLIALAFVFPLIFIFVRQQDPVRQLKKIIAPHLLNHLLVQTERKSRLQPYHLLAIGMIIFSFALAGPSWQRESLPFAEDEAALVIVIDLSESMTAVDIKPSRLERAQQKIMDLIELRQGTRIGLVAYAGSAHMVLPLGDDANILKTYVDALAPEIMPELGKNAPAALQIAQKMLLEDSANGTILFLTDGINSEYADAFASYTNSYGNSIEVLAIGTTQGGPIPSKDGGFLRTTTGELIMASFDEAGFEILQGESGVSVTYITVDDTDIRRISGNIDTKMQMIRDNNDRQRWKDFGYWLVIPLVGLSLVWFRRGWTLQWLGSK